MYELSAVFAAVQSEVEAAAEAQVQKAKQEVTQRKPRAGFAMPVTVQSMLRNLARREKHPIWEKVQEALPALWSTASAYTRDPIRCEDFMQDVFVKVSMNKDKFDLSQPVLPWLRTMMRNIKIDQSRAKKSRIQEDQFDAVSHENVLSTQPNQIDHLNLQDADRAFKRTPHEMQEILALVVMEDMTYNEASKLLDCPIPTLKKRAQSGRKYALIDLHWGEDLEPANLNNVVPLKQARRAGL